MNLVLNSESFGFDGNAYEARAILEKFLTTYSHIMSEYRDRFANTLYTSVDLNDVTVGGYGFSAWRNDGPDRDLFSKFRSIRDRQTVIPYDELTDLSDSDKEVSYQGEPEPLFQYAVENDCSLISFATGDEWMTPFIEVRVDFIDDTPAETTRIKNFYDSDLLGDEDLEWIWSVARLDYPERGELLDKPERVFPNLIFHPRALGQLRDEIRGGWYDALVEQLSDLNEKCGMWTDGEFSLSWFTPMRVSRNSEETLRQFSGYYTFTYMDETYVATLHMRYTPPGGARGRIYFEPVRNMRRCIIYSLKEHFPCVKYPHGN